MNLSEKVFKLETVTPTRKFFQDEVEMIILKTQKGEMGVLRGHIPMVCAVEVGNIKIKQNGEWIIAVVTEGFAEITQDNVVIMTDTAEWPEEIDENRAEEAKRRAEERIQSQISRVEYIRSKAALARAMARLRIKNKKF